MALLGRTTTIDEGFTPSGTPAAWWPVDAITGLADDDPCGTLPDHYGNYDLTQATAGNKPTYKTDIQNGLPVLRGDGVSSYMDVDFGADKDQPNTIFIVGRFITNTYGRYMCEGYNSNKRHGFLIGFQDYKNTFNAYAGANLYGQLSDTDFHIWALLFNGASSWIRQDGVEDTGNSGTQLSNGFTLFAGYGGINFGNCDIGEVIWYDGAEDTTANEAGLNTKWTIY